MELGCKKSTVVYFFCSGISFADTEIHSKTEKGYSSVTFPPGKYIQAFISSFGSEMTIFSY